MTSLTIHLPDDLADEAKRKGLLDPVQVTELIRQAVNNPKATDDQKTLLQQTSGSLQIKTRFALGLMSDQNVWVSDDFGDPLDERFNSLES
ncbi:hypothetical protein GCM10023206_23680 [Acinetobacter puyangensis]|uniref:Uncharacterized protein n=1 Tax=Acinetobacter puyangensis TaxID=1096779 RepID=A0A240EEJ4_9GAMM|nr:hypothetical protein [Acinetobacter puyangensis]SNX46350.1 hypothetical protein SAMN05421731_11097 [Acinetobacter puyangensis]